MFGVQGGHLLSATAGRRRRLGIRKRLAAQGLPVEQPLQRPGSAVWRPSPGHPTAVASLGALGNMRSAAAAGSCGGQASGSM